MLVLFLVLLLPVLPCLTPPARATEPWVPQHTFHFHAGDLMVHETCAGSGQRSGDFVEVGYRNAESDHDPARLGYPCLPVLTRHFILPPETRVENLRVTVRSVEAYPGSYRPLPIQPDSGAFMPPEPEIYTSYEPYPAEPIRLTVDSFMAGYHLVTIQIWPVQFVGALERLLVVTDVEVEAAFRPLTAEESRQVFRRLRADWEPFEHRAEVRWLERHVLNPGGVERFYRSGDPSETGPGHGPAPLAVHAQRPFGGFVPTGYPSLEGPPVELVIITNDQRADGTELPGMTEAFQDWADWKTQKGVPAVVKTVTWIEANYAGIDRPERIRAFVQEAAAKWGTEYVLLGGDVEVVPVRYLGGPAGLYYGLHLRADPPADSYYAELDDCWNQDGDAFFADGATDASTTMLMDVWVGRVPVRDPVEVAQFFGKVGSYECRPGCDVPADASYYEEVLLAAGPTNGWCTDLSNGVFLAEAIADSIESSVFDMDITRMYPDFPSSMAFPCGTGGPSVRCFATMIDSVMGGAPDVFFTQDNFESELNDGPAYVFHLEHSMREFLGLMSDEAVGRFSGCTTCYSTTWKDDCKAALKSYLKSTYPGWAGYQLGKQIADNLTNGADQQYFTLVTCGSYTNQYDLDCIGEHLLRNPEGGAIAYFARTSSSIMGFGPPRNFFGGIFKDQILTAGTAAGLAANQDNASTKAGIHWRLLGDPEMPLWTRVPGTLRFTQTPTTVNQLGPQSITIEVEDNETSEAVAGARVCLKDRDKSFAVAWTGADGQAYFPSFQVSSTDSISIVATADNYKPRLQWLRFGSAATPHCIVYDQHQWDDAVTGGDADDLLEAGESIALRVTAGDMGSCQSQSGEITAHLWPTPPILFDLAVYGRHDSRTVYIGAHAAHPPAVADAFRLPGNWEAIRPEGMPVPSDTSMSSLLVWRATDGHWCIHSLPGDDDPGQNPTFAGTLSTEGGFSEVWWDTTDAGVSVDFDPNDPDTLRFEFTPSDSSDQDELRFRAEAGDWVDVLTDSIALGSLAAGDTASGVFEVVWDEEIPDREEMVFTLAAHDTLGTWWFSDFSEHVHAPRVEYVAQRTEIEENSESEPSTWILSIWPSLSNLGSAPADSLGLELERTAGSMTVLDGDLTVGPIEPRTFEDLEDCFRLEAASAAAFDGLLYELEITTYYTNDSTRVATREDQDVVAPNAPEDLIVDESGGALNLRWSVPNPADTTVVGYHIYRVQPEDTTRVTLEPVMGTTRYEVVDLAAMDSICVYYDYRYAVTAVDGSGNGSDPQDAVSDASRVWLPELEGWPRRVMGGSDCAPKVYDVEGDGELEIFAAGRDIYAWRCDGTALIEGSAGDPDGLFYTPQGIGTEAHFVEALALADIDGDGNVEIVGNTGKDGGLHVVRCDTTGQAITADLAWQNLDVESWKSAPILADLNPGTPGDGLEILLPGNDHWVHVWTAEGQTFRHEQTDDGKFKGVYSASTFRYRSLSVGDIQGDDKLEIIQAAHKKWNDIDTCFVVAYPTGTYDTDALLWTVWKGGKLSTPVLGDLDGDTDLEIVTTRKPGDGRMGALWALNAGNGSQHTWFDGLPWRFAGDGHPPAALAPLDDNTDLDIVIGGGANRSDLNPIRTLRIHTVCDAGTSPDTATVTDDLPVPGSKFSCLDTYAQPVVGDIDGDGNLECLVSTDSGYLAGFEWDDDDDEMRPEPGWPQYFGDIPLPPVIANVDGGDHLELVVQDRSGLIHVFHLPAGTTADLPWPEYGHDPRNTFNYTTSRDLDSGGGSRNDLMGGSRRTPLSIGPNPLGQAVAWAVFRIEQAEPVRLEVFDLQGRRVEMLLDEELTPGRYRVPWDGAGEQNHPAASGIYFFRLTHGDQTEVRKISVVR